MEIYFLGVSSFKLVIVGKLLLLETDNIQDGIFSSAQCEVQLNTQSIRITCYTVNQENFVIKNFHQ